MENCLKDTSDNLKVKECRNEVTEYLSCNSIDNCKKVTKVVYGYLMNKILEETKEMYKKWNGDLNIDYNTKEWLYIFTRLQKSDVFNKPHIFLLPFIT